MAAFIIGRAYNGSRIYITSNAVAIATLASPPSTLLRNVRWETYQNLVNDLESQPSSRLTYDCGTLEIAMPRSPHETYKKLLARLVEIITEELEIEIRSFGSTTWSRADLQKGIEPDECYYIQNEEAIRHKSNLDLAVDPPPDLAIEIDVTSSSLDRLGIYAALGVGEIWRYDLKALTILTLEDGVYESVDQSKALPILTVAMVTDFLTNSQTLSETQLMREMRRWVRSQG
ncbi:MAG: Uma2 family endonuclease [Cyanobacteria bacterium P01_F01_bin.153]